MILEGNSQVILKWLKQAAEASASDISIGAGRRINFKINGEPVPQGTAIVKPHDAIALVTGLYELARRSMERFNETGDDDFLVTVPDTARFRVNAYRQRNTLAAAIRVVPFEVPDFKKLHIPEEVMSMSKEINGISLVTGPSGSGKSTTLACVLNAINNTRKANIITLEDPIEYLHRDKKCFIAQREVSTDTESYIVGLRACLRQDPDVIFVGEMRDQETIRTAITAAETGHYVISTLHTIGAANTIERIIDNFPPGMQQQVRTQLSSTLRVVVSQRLMTDVNGNLIPAFEVMRTNLAIKNILKEGKTHMIQSTLMSNVGKGMTDMDSYILGMVRNRLISRDTAIKNALEPEYMMEQLSKL